MTVNVNTGFDDQDYLRDIRKVVLNPIAVKVAGLENTVQTVRTEMGPMFQGVSADIPGKAIIFHQKNGSDAPVLLEGMFGEGSDLTVVDGTGKEEHKVKEITLTDSNMIKDTLGGVEIIYDWTKIVKDHQKDLVVGKTNEGVGNPTKSIFFKGSSVKVDQTTADITTVEIPTIPAQLTATMPDASPAITVPVAVNTIALEGATTSSTLKDGKLTIHLNEGGGSTLAVGNFKGFFDSLGDIISQVTDAKDGKSFAFAKDSKLGGSYYTPYFYVNGNWTELKQDPALTYNAPTSATSQGVFSIKPSDKISVDANGQLDLDGLSTPQLPSHFKGFFNSLDELNVAVPNPVLDQDWAYVKDGNGWKILRNEMHGSVSRKWNVKAPLGSFAVVNRKDDPNSYAQVFGIYKNDSWDVDSKGILSLKTLETDTDIIIADHKGDTTGGKVKTIKFVDGKTIAEISGSELILQHPQQVINYASAWELAHAGEDYRGNLFYDATSKCWMGWSDPDAGGGVDKKWTRIIHRNMSDEVKSLVRRVPVKAPDVLPGVLEDSGYWHFNGVTFLEKDSDQLPDELQNKCGAYITTTVQDRDAAGIDIPQYRMQSCTADREEGGTWVRRFVSAGSPGGQTGWSNWVRTSFSHKDIEAHSADPGAHKEHIKFYKATSFSAQYSLFYNQQEGGSAGGVRSDNCSLIADNYGALVKDQDFLQPPYDGKFHMRGAIGLAGYNDGKNLPANGQWNILIRLRHAGESNWSTIGHFRSEATPVNTKQFPLMGFSTGPIEMLKTDEVIINITHTDTQNLVTNHPGLYFVPFRSAFVLEDENTVAGFQIARTFGKFIGVLDIMQGVGLRVHHATLTDPKSTVRVYGQAMPSTVTPMQKLQ